MKHADILKKASWRIAEVAYLTAILMCVAIFVSLFQPIWVVDKLILLTALLMLFLGGVGIGLTMARSLITKRD